MKNRDGLLIQIEDNIISIDCDPHANSSLSIISHAHADHIPSKLAGNKFLCSEMTYQLVKRRVREFRYATKNARVQMYESGHVPGSKSFLISGKKDVLYTGDFSIRDRMHMNGFEPPQSDILIIESTYGHPSYVFDNQEQIESRIVSWFQQKSEQKLVCKGYSLGRAQEIEILAKRAGFENIYVNKAIKNMNEILSKGGRQFSDRLYTGEMQDSSVLITSSGKHIEKLSKREDTTTAIFTGWAKDNRYNNSQLYDKSFVLTDHADFDELLETVRDVSPEKVYTVHGYKDRLANEIVSQLGINSQSLKNNQTTIQNWV